MTASGAAPEARLPERAAAPGDDSRERLLAWVRLLADEAGPRRPATGSERRAAELVLTRLDERGVRGRLEDFEGFSTFGEPLGLMTALTIAPGLLPRRWAGRRAALAAAAAALLAIEGGLVRTPVSDALARRASQNLVAEIEPSGEARRTLCLLCHLDTSRGGLMFHPAFVPYLTNWLLLQSAAGVLQGGELVLSRSRGGRSILRLCRGIMLAGAALLAERELRGVDSPGANDNASGVAVVAELAAELAADPLESTRVVVLMAGCEEVGLLGTQAFLRSRDTSGWLFLNIDSVGGPGDLRYLPREGIARRWDADAGLAAVAERAAAEDPALGLRAAERQVGLTYDATAAMARGGRAITLVAERNGVIPNYHRPTDTTKNLDPDTLARALDAARAIAKAVDRGEAG